MAIDATLTDELQALKEELAAGRGEPPAGRTCRTD